MDLDPIEFKPTWKNRRTGEYRIEKRLDRFLLEERLLTLDPMIKQWVDYGGDTYHLSICPKNLRNPKNPASPFKLCAAWIKNEDVLRLIQDSWIPYIADEGSHAAIHISQNMARVKNS